MSESERICFIPVEVKMARISTNHFQIGFLIRILEAELESKSVGKRKIVVDAVTRI